MSNLMIRLPFAVTDNSIPILYADPIIDAGALMLWDPSRSGLSTFQNGSVIPDIAADVSAPLMGVDKSLTNTVLKVPAFPTEFLTEKTAKGGLHIITTQNALGGNNRNVNLPFSSPVRNYIDSHRTHLYYASFWGIFTRLPAAERPFFVFSPSSYAANYYFYMRNPGTSGPIAGATYSPSNAPAVGVPFLYTIAFNSKTGSDFDVNATTTWSGLFQGAFSGAASGLGSIIMEKAYLTDLTVGNISAADKRAKDLALFNAAFAPAAGGVAAGRFANEAWTVPAL